MTGNRMRQVAQVFLSLLLIITIAACAKGPMHQPPADYYVPPHPQSPYAPPVPETMDMTQTPPGMPVGPEVRVGLLVPLSGDSAELGQSLLDAAMLALFDKYSTTPKEGLRTQLVIIPKDTEGNPQGAAKAAEQAIAEGAKLLIGPLFSDSVRAVAPIAAKSGTHVLSFSNNRAVAEKGVFLFGFMPDQQVDRVVKEAFDRHSSRIGALLPANAYGKLVADSLRRMTIMYNKPLTGIEFYPPSATDIDMEIQRLIGGRVGGGEPPLDALLLAEGGDRLGMLLARLKNFGITNANVQLLGTGVWDNPDLATMNGLAGGWFASAPLRAYRGFEQRFSHANGYLPPRLASLAYDAVALAATLAQSPGGPDFSLMALTDPSGYSGPANGIFRLNNDGVCVRGLAVLEVGRGDLRELAPAPRSFMP